MCVACLLMAIHFFRKIAGTLKTLNILAIFLSVDFDSAMCSWVAINFYSRNGNAIISDSCIAMVDEKLPMQLWLEQKVNEVFTVMRISASALDCNNSRTP